MTFFITKSLQLTLDGDQFVTVIPIAQSEKTDPIHVGDEAFAAHENLADCVEDVGIVGNTSVIEGAAGQITPVTPDSAPTFISEVLDNFDTQSVDTSIHADHVTKLLKDAKRQGWLRLLWLRGPPLAIGLLLAGIGCVMAVFCKFGSVGHAMYHMFWIAASVVLLVSASPFDRRLIQAYMALFLLVAVCYSLVCTRYILAFLKQAHDNGCPVADVSNFLLELLFPLPDDLDPPCWYFTFFAVTEGLSAVVGNVAAGWTSFGLLLKMTSADLLERQWRGVGAMWLGIATVNIARAAAGIHAQETFHMCRYVLEAACNIMGFVACRQKKSIERVQAWLTSRGEGASAAAGVAQALGGHSPSSVLMRARNTFTSVPAGRIRKDDMTRDERLKPNAALAAYAVKSSFGKVDAFMSHSWHDDADLKWTKLQTWIGDFKKKHRREPLIWIDKYCIDQNNVEDSLACLPVYLSGCRKLVIFFGETYLQRLWCLVEIFIFLEMGGTLDRLDVIPLQDNLDPLPLRQKIETFDPFDARCFNDDDTERLQAVIAVGGYDRLTALVHDVFGKHVHQVS